MLLSVFDRFGSSGFGCDNLGCDVEYSSGIVIFYYIYISMILDSLIVIVLFDLVVNDILLGAGVGLLVLYASILSIQLDSVADTIVVVGT